MHNFRSIAAGLSMAVAVGLATLPSANATIVGTEAAVQISPTGFTPIGISPRTAGWSFSLSAARTATHLGIYDLNASGTGNLESARRIGLWDSGGTLILDATVPAGPGALFEQGFVYVALGVPAELSAGEIYTLGAYYDDNNSPGLVRDAIFTEIQSGLSIVATTLASAPGVFAKPTLDFSGTNGYFGPNIRFIPEPGTLAVLGLGLAALAVARRRRLA